MALLDPYAVPVTVPTSDTTGTQLIELVKAAADQGTMVNITFHGVGGDHLAVSAEAHEALIAYLASHQDVYWTGTFIEIMKQVKNERDAHHRTRTQTTPSN